MRRRRFIAAAGTAATVATAGCLGGGGEVVVSIKRTVTVMPGQGWVKKVPDLSDTGGSVQYKAKSDSPFDVYFFVGEPQFLAYDDYTDGEEPSKKPKGNTTIGQTATKDGDTYRAQTPDGGSRVSISETGPYFFVVDHSAYRGQTPPGEQPSDISVWVELTVARNNSLI